MRFTCCVQRIAEPFDVIGRQAVRRDLGRNRIEHTIGLGACQKNPRLADARPW